MKVVISTGARADLAEIQDFIAEDNPTRAESFVEELVSCCEDLGDTHHRYPVVPRYRHVGFRRRVHKKYLIFYIVRGTTVEIARVIHGARDYERLLGRDDDPSV
jgi:toxin ParE1/3/4